MSIIRSGSVNNQLLFIPNRKTTSYYNTQFGSFFGERFKHRGGR
ncbi:MAG: DUF1934 domain-containing protein [Clostridiales bacterium]|nr:MAG: DUF1934 domain-containing protein [Clostridiales bacterium]